MKPRSGFLLAPLVVATLASSSVASQIPVSQNLDPALGWLSRPSVAAAMATGLGIGQETRPQSTALPNSAFTLPHRNQSAPPRAAALNAVASQPFNAESIHGQRGATLSLATDPAFATKIAALLDHVAAFGVNSLSVLVWFKQSTYTSSDPQPTSYTATPGQMQMLIAAAHQRGMSVMIRPLMDDGNLAPQWRGTVLPSDPATWFSTYYNNVISPYSTLNGVDAVDIGSEMATLANKLPGRWLSLITTLRSLSPAVRLTYSSTDWIALPGEQQPYPTFAESLDLIGIDAFFPLNGVTNGYDVGQLINAWQPSLGKVNRLATYYHKPVVFTEIGLASQCCTLSQPFVWNSGAATNLQAQAAYYAAACRAIRPWRIGLYWWSYDRLDPLPSPTTDNAFSPYGKPAEQEMARCYQSGY